MHDCRGGCLFNVEVDPTEHHDLANDAEHAGTLAKLQAELQNLNRKLFSPDRGEPQLSSCLSFVDKGGFYGPFASIEGYYSPVPAPSASKRQKDAKLKQELELVNKDFVERWIVGRARQLVPKLRKVWMQSLDTCLQNGTSLL